MDFNSASNDALEKRTSEILLLGKTADSSAIKPLKQALGNKEWYIRKNAAIAFGNLWCAGINSLEIISALEKGLEYEQKHEHNHEVIAAISNSLKRINDARKQKSRVSQRVFSSLNEEVAYLLTNNVGYPNDKNVEPDMKAWIESGGKGKPPTVGQERDKRDYNFYYVISTLLRRGNTLEERERTIKALAVELNNFEKGEKGLDTVARVFVMSTIDEYADIRQDLRKLHDEKNMVCINEGAELMKSDDSAVRKQGVWLMERTRDVRAFEHLKNALGYEQKGDKLVPKEPVTFVQRALVKAVCKVASYMGAITKDAIKFLEEMRENELNAGRDEGVLINIDESLKALNKEFKFGASAAEQISKNTLEAGGQNMKDFKTMGNGKPGAYKAAVTSKTKATNKLKAF